ncbi:MAG: tetratricopeptide repeat protein [Candidatus Eisenbacteria bacterium]|uniref:Tetratricopeptide repeat protein n=1 Tax=Eiseniibacteriota bacterium TaxID=2212470 RepID=A0A538SI19_UNCEI|nr:MAG: tetratricopeptide repeat protein [Candidatus Eisenbacteria bacterium]
MTSGIYAFVLGGALLALVGWAAWTLSGGFTTDRRGPETPFRRGLDALLRGENEEALLAFAETVRIDTDNVDAYIHIGNLLRERGEPARAINVHRELTVRSGLTTAQERTVRESLVLDLIALGRADQAVEEAEDLRELDRKNPNALQVLLRAHEAAGNWERAYEVRSEMARLNGERGNGSLAKYRSAAGESFLRAGKTREAERQFKSALRLDKNHPAALLRLGDICYRRDHRDRAIVFWKWLARMHPGLAHLVLDRLETAYFERGRFSEIPQAYEELLSRNPRDARILIALARMYEKKGDLPEAAATLSRALKIDSDSVEARLLLVNVHRRLGDLSSALDEVEALLRAVPKTERFACASCGATSDEFWTRCPECHAFSQPSTESTPA